MDLHTVARNGDIPGLQAAIAAGGNLNARDKLSRTPLIMAAWSGHVEVVRLLLAHGCTATAAAGDDMNALHFAAQRGHTEVCRRLITAGIHVNSKTRKGATALMMAAQHGHLETVQLLLQRRANPVAANHKGQTALDVAKNDEVKTALQEALATYSTTGSKAKDNTAQDDDVGDGAVGQGEVQAPGDAAAPAPAAASGSMFRSRKARGNKQQQDQGANEPSAAPQHTEEHNNASAQADEDQVQGVADAGHEPAGVIGMDLGPFAGHEQGAENPADPGDAVSEPGQHATTQLHQTAPELADRALVDGDGGDKKDQGMSQVQPKEQPPAKKQKVILNYDDE